jgi:hypothetical protein
MTFKEEIDLQLMDNKMLSFEIMTQLKDKTYFSGREKQVGDTVLFGMLRETLEEDKSTVRLITFHEKELGVLYEQDTTFYKPNKANKLPNIKKI